MFVCQRILSIGFDICQVLQYGTFLNNDKPIVHVKAYLWDCKNK